VRNRRNVKEGTETSYTHRISRGKNISEATPKLQRIDARKLLEVFDSKPHDTNARENENTELGTAIRQPGITLPLLLEEREENAKSPLVKVDPFAQIPRLPESPTTGALGRKHNSRQPHPKIKSRNAFVNTLPQPETGIRKEARNRVSRAKERSVSPVEETRTQKPVEEHETRTIKAHQKQNKNIDLTAVRHLLLEGLVGSLLLARGPPCCIARGPIKAGVVLSFSSDP
jgi:hypothetical protein